MRKIKTDRRKNELIMAVMLITAVFVLMWWIARPTFVVNKSSVGQTPLVENVRRAIDGVLVEKGKENPAIVGVMVENMVEAQPLSGIADARLVFEAVTEANITRFLAYFILENTPSESPPPRGGEKTISSPAGGEVRRGGSEIGPVRSARPYYLDFAAEFDTLYGHVGSSPAAYELLRKKGVDGVHDLDQWYNSQYFFEKLGRQRPHHLYTSSWLLGEGVRTFAAARDDRKIGVFSPWQFKDDASPDLRGDVTDITIGYTPPYNVKWQYDAQANQYGRAQWGGPHKDAVGKAIIAKNIAVAFMEMKILDAVGRKEFTTIGEGKGLVFQDGRVVVGIWKKPTSRERIRFYDGQGNEVKFNAGTTWVEIVPKGYEVTY